jgi:hypothetical protein
VTRDELIDVGVRALAEYQGDEVSEIDVVAVLDAVEPLIRADEKERMREHYVALLKTITDAGLAGLRAKVEALAGVHEVWLYRDDVLALLDGSNDE